MFSLYRLLAGSAVLAAVLGGGVVARAEEAANGAQVSYITGGIGEDEQHTMEASAARYDLLVTNAQPSGAYTAGTDLVITDRAGRDVLDARNTGPLLYAQLPPGKYVLHATFRGLQREQSVEVSGQRPSRISLIWPQE